MSNKIKKLKDKLNKTIWTDNIEKLNPHLYEQRGNIKGKSSLLMLPKNTEDVVKIVKFCKKNKIPVICFPKGLKKNYKLFVSKFAESIHKIRFSEFLFSSIIELFHA